MTLKVWIPTELVVNEEIAGLRAEAEYGWFGMLPRHVDFVTSLLPGILSFDLPGGRTEYLAVDRGVLVKCGPSVAVSTRNAVRSADPAALKTAIEKQLRVRQESDQALRELEAKLEADLVRQLMEIEKHA
jgi:F-type H+-transporting ATPase subunit epsilon